MSWLWVGRGLIDVADLTGVRASFVYRLQWCDSGLVSTLRVKISNRMAKVTILVIGFTIAVLDLSLLKVSRLNMTAVRLCGLNYLTKRIARYWKFALSSVINIGITCSMASVSMVSRIYRYRIFVRSMPSRTLLVKNYMMKLNRLVLTLTRLEALRLLLKATSVVLKTRFVMKVATNMPVLMILVILNSISGIVVTVRVWLWGAS